jgi:hypothetical protein
LLLTHRAGLTPEGDRFALDVGVDYLGEAPHCPDYLVAGETLPPALRTYNQVLYERGSRVRSHAGATVLASVGLPYFTRSHRRYMSHQHTPFDRVGEDPAVVHAGRVLYCHSPLFGAYHRHAVPYYRELLGALLDRLAPEHVLSAGDLPTTAEVSLLRQRQDDRTILHVVHAVPQRRGEGVDVVEHVLPLYSVGVGVRRPQSATSTTPISRRRCTSGPAPRPRQARSKIRLPRLSNVSNSDIADKGDPISRENVSDATGSRGNCLRS